MYLSVLNCFISCPLLLLLVWKREFIEAQFTYGDGYGRFANGPSGLSDPFYWQQQQNFLPDRSWQLYNGGGGGSGRPHSRPYRQQSNFAGYHHHGEGGRPHSRPYRQQNNFAGYHHPHYYGDGNRNWQHAHRAPPRRYRNFRQVFRDIERGEQNNNQFNATAEDAETDDDFNGRSIAAPGQYPHMAAIGFRSNAERVTFKCGGSLISEIYVLTAAHCCEINGEAPYVVKFGDINLKKFERDIRPQRRFVRNYYLFPDYNASLLYHDIALILLNNPIEYTEFVRPIRLWANDEIPYERVYTMGYGSTSFAQAPTNILTEMALSIVSLEKCNTLMPRDESAPLGVIDSQICAKDYIKNRDTCQGDSGGPLQLNLERRRKRRNGNRFRYYLVGIISYGGFCRGQLPGVYTRVSSYIDWIASIVWPQYFDFNNS